jgi:NADPH-dependent glutamate synthase beta subunit-like oxidoreductase
MAATIRFSKLVETAGKPSNHLLWSDPAKDQILQNAIRGQRVLTVRQRPVDAKTDYGTVGYEKGVPGQILIFPKSIKQFADKRVIGVKYDLLEWPTANENRSARRTIPAKRSTKKIQKESPLPVVAPRPTDSEEPVNARVVKFPEPEAGEKAGTDAEIEDLKNKVRQAIKLLEEGKQVAAFNLLRQAVPD